MPSGRLAPKRLQDYLVDLARRIRTGLGNDVQLAGRLGPRGDEDRRVDGILDMD
jgi:hypothetical protein